MKKIIIIILSLTIVILSVFYVKYLDYKNLKSEVEKYNLQYDMYLHKDIDGRELTSIINKAVDNNEKNSIGKDEQGLYIENDTTSVKIDIKMTDIDFTYNMETIYNGKMENFISLYNSIYFRCEEVKYNSLGKIKYIRFIQTTN